MTIQGKKAGPMPEHAMTTLSMLRTDENPKFSVTLSILLESVAIVNCRSCGI